MPQIVTKPSLTSRWPRFARGLLLAGLAAVAGCDRDGDSEPAAETFTAQAEYVGGQVCAGCHQDETALWQASHHDLAMQSADADSVLGDFDNAEFRYGDVTTRFFRRDGEFVVSTDGPDGNVAEFDIAYTLGVDPLQQYLVAFDDGRVQALSIAWDTRSQEQGGQRWFHLYPEEDVDFEDPLHWTGVYQSWNTMCADCHSTGLVKGYDPAADRFDTEFASIDVDCEACHGPGSLHAEDPENRASILPRLNREWVFAAAQSIASLQTDNPSSNEIEVCAQCHSRRAQLVDTNEPGDPLFDAYRPASLEPGLYHADGQILDEVYVYGSFLQSAMAAAGVICSDCHEPHSTALRAEGNALCGQCHLASVFDQPAHHRHVTGSDAAQCTACHMRAETFMQVDPRRDHSFRVPRPDLSVSLGNPNACNDCHQDETSNWAADRVAEWYPDGRQNESHFGMAIYAGRSWEADAGTELSQLIEDQSEPAIVRATAMNLLVERGSAPAVALIQSGLDQNDPMLLLAAINAAAALTAERRVDLLQRFLTHELLAVRIESARVLLTARNLLSARRQLDLNAAIDEYFEVQTFNGDRPEGLLNMASIAVDQGLYDDAEGLYLAAIERHSRFPALYVNLSDLYRVTDRPADSERVLRNGLINNPNDASLNFALGLAVVRNGRPAEALPLFAEAAAASPDQPYYQFVRAIALNDMGDGDFALDLLRSTHEAFPGHADTLFALATILRDAGSIEEALQYAERLNVLRPADPNARELLSELEQRL